MKRAFVAAVLAASLISLVALAAAAQSPQQWSRQSQNGFQTFDPIGQNEVQQGEAVQDATSAPSQSPTATPTPAATSLPLQTGQQIVSTATRPPTPRPTPRPIPAPVKAPAPAPRRVSVPTVSQAKAYVLSVVGSTQYSCAYQLWQRESGWNTFAQNPRSGAYGIPQALPGYKMAVFGADWRYDPVTQVKWGLSYVRSRYGSACGAWSYWLSHGWY